MNYAHDSMTGQALEIGMVESKDVVNRTFHFVSVNALYT